MVKHKVVALFVSVITTIPLFNTLASAEILTVPNNSQQNQRYDNRIQTNTRFITRTYEPINQNNNYARHNKVRRSNNSLFSIIITPRINRREEERYEEHRDNYRDYRHKKKHERHDRW